MSEKAPCKTLLMQMKGWITCCRVKKAFLIILMRFCTTAAIQIATENPYFSLFLCLCPTMDLHYLAKPET